MGTRRLILCILVVGAILALYFPSDRLPEPYRWASAALGWSYPLAWGISFFPQVILAAGAAPGAGPALAPPAALHSPRLV